METGRILQEVLLAGIKEQRCARRWKIFFRLVFLAIILVLIYFNYINPLNKTSSSVITKEHTALINIEGLIMSEEVASAENIINALSAAYKNKDVKGIVLRINSPGGSPVQARQIFAEIQRQKTLRQDIKIYAAIEDIGTSAAYLIACGADEIYADATSLVGSIGAAIDSFGFVGAMDKVGVERRLYTAGNHKNILDPFSPVTEEDKAFITQQLEKVHQQFIGNVERGRGQRLKITKDLFSGKFWVGEEALALGLIDGFSNYRDLAREQIKAERLVNYTQKSSLFDKLSNKLGVGMQCGFSKLSKLYQGVEFK